MDKKLGMVQKDNKDVIIDQLLAENKRLEARNKELEQLLTTPEKKEE